MSISNLEQHTYQHLLIFGAYFVALTSLSTLVAHEKHIAANSGDHATDNLTVNTNLLSKSMYDEEIILVIPDDLNRKDVQTFEHRQQLQLSDLTGYQTIIEKELESDEEGEGGQVVNNFVLDGYELLHEATVNGDWGEARKFLEDPEEITKPITSDLHTVLDLAIYNMVDLMFVEEIVKLMPPKALEKKTAEGLTPLHYAAACGYAKAAKLIVTKNPKTTQIISEDVYKLLPLLLAVGTISVGQKETVEYLYSVTRHEHPSPFSGHQGASNLCRIIDAGFNNIASSIVQRFPRLVTERTKVAKLCGLELIAERPFAFASGRKRTFWERCIYSSIQVNIGSTYHSNHADNTKSSKEELLLESWEATSGDEENPLERFKGSHSNKENSSSNSENSEGDNANVSTSSNQGVLIMLISAYLMPAMKQGFNLVNLKFLLLNLTSFKLLSYCDN
ncbi:hypothetical protein MKX03_024235 [Papaver bracteatum]|nr:hypothetical protein MKX03_024235 [Papaver bracteatum]